MAITLTGSKSNGAVASVGTYTVTTTAAVFSSGDYSVSRYAVLFTSAGVFKGIARVRGYSSTTVLNLMTAFYDPVDGSTVAQVVGDLVHVSVNLSEVTVSGAGWTYTAAGAVATDAVYFGTAASQTSLVLHDGGRTILSTWAGSAAVGFFQFRGGVCVFGTPAEPTSNDVFQPVTLSISSALASGAFVAVSNESSLPSVVFYGGGIGEMTAGSTDRRPLVFNINPKTFVGVSANLPMVQGSTASARHVLRNCSFTQLNAGASILMWGSGVIDGGFIRSSQAYTTYAVFRVASAGTYAYGASAGQRMVVSDANAALPATFASSVFAYTVNFTNFVGVPRTAYATFSATPNNSATNNFYYSDTFTGVVIGSTAQVRLDSDSSLVDSTLGSGATWAPTVWRDSYTGATQNSGFPHGPWTYGIKRYGRAAVAGAIAASNYDLGAAGTADNVAFGGAVVQATDAAVTLSEAAALALTSIDSLDDLYDALIAWNCASVANAAYPSLGAYPCTSGGGVLDLGALDLVVDATAASAIAVNTGSHVATIKSAALAAGSKHSSLTTTGTVSTANGAEVSAVYTDATGTSASLTLAGLQDASVLLVDGSGATVEFQAAQSGEFDYVYNFAPGATGTWRWVAKAPGREHATGTFTPGAGGAFSYAPVLTQKLTPSGDPMYTGTTSALVSVSIPGTTTAYIDIGDGTAPLQESFNETELALVTQAGLEWLAAGKDDVSVFDSGSGDYLFLTAGWRLRRASAGDANAAIEAYVASADGTIVDDTNGPVLYLTSNTPAAIAAAVWAYIDRELTQAIPTAAQIADTMLGRNLAGGSDGGRTVRDALRASRNKSAISGSTLTIYQEDDATPAWTAAVSTAERDALQSIDPA